MKKEAESFIKLFDDSLEGHRFVQLIASDYKGTEPELKSLILRKVNIKRSVMMSVTYRYKTRDIIKNYALAEIIKKLSEFIDAGFYSLTLFTILNDTQLETSDGQIYRILVKSPSYKTLPDQSHDRKKKRLLQTVSKSYLTDLGITSSDGHVRKDAQDKLRQIEKYIEIMSGLIRDLPSKNNLKIADMGSGKGYLTFSLYDYVRTTMGLNAVVEGVESRPDLVQFCNDIAKKNNFADLYFTRGNIAQYKADGASVMIALHACDTATDDAIAKGIRAKADLIVVAPCCHKQIRREMEKRKTDTPLDFITSHGIFMERQAEMATDILRSQILELYGYKTKIFEFISSTHTSKNIMIVASRDQHYQKRNIYLEHIKKTKDFFSIRSHYLETCLSFEDGIDKV